MILISIALWCFGISLFSTCKFCYCVAPLCSSLLLTALLNTTAFDLSLLLLTIYFHCYDYTICGHIGNVRDWKPQSGSLLLVKAASWITIVKLCLSGHLGSECRKTLNCLKKLGLKWCSHTAASRKYHALEILIDVLRKVAKADNVLCSNCLRIVFLPNARNDTESRTVKIGMTGSLHDPWDWATPQRAVHLWGLGLWFASHSLTANDQLYALYG